MMQHSCLCDIVKTLMSKEPVSQDVAENVFLGQSVFRIFLIFNMMKNI